MKCGMLESCKQTQKQNERKNGKSKRKSKGEKKGKANLRPSRQQLSSALLHTDKARTRTRARAQLVQSREEALLRQILDNVFMYKYYQLCCVCAPGIGFPIVTTAPLELGLRAATENNRFKKFGIIKDSTYICIPSLTKSSISDRQTDGRSSINSYTSAQSYYTIFNA